MNTFISVCLFLSLEFAYYTKLCILKHLCKHVDFLAPKLSILYQLSHSITLRSSENTGSQSENSPKIKVTTHKSGLSV